MQEISIKDMQEIANGRGGECLSKKYINSKSKLKWRCKERHEWEAVPSSVKAGTWCPVCAGTQKSTIEKMHEIAKDRGGKCLSERYINESAKLTWQCKVGHQWETAPSNLKQGSWCPTCSGVRKNTIEDMQKIAKERGGKCLSKEYINNRSRLKWQCKNGHRWEAVPGNVQQGNWCAVCAGTKKRTIEEMHEIAEERGGKCLSTVYIDAHSNLAWQCEDGHRWNAVPASIINQKSWCPFCGGTQKGTLEEAQKTAKERGGRCLSKEYIRALSPLIWQCKEGHPSWEANFSSIKRGSWCPHCHVYYGEEIVRFYFEETFNKKFPRSWPAFLKKDGRAVRELDGYNVELGIAFEHQGRQHYEHIDYFHVGGQSLKSTQEKDKLRAELCAKNGVKLIVIPAVPEMLSVSELPDVLKSELDKKGIKGFSIPERLNINVIYKRSVPMVDRLRMLAEEKEGILVSHHYLGNHIKLTWQCKVGHQWKATPGHIKSGQWCPACAGKQKDTIEGMRKIAADRHGQCLSEEYKNDITKITWQCGAGHQWEAVPGSIKQGSWCPVCAGKQKGTIKGMQEIAIERGGRCLSEVYTNAHTPLIWLCKASHQWEAIPDRVKRGSWCPVCAGVQKGTIEEMQKIAADREGMCLSKEYINSKSKIRWQCKNGHQWEATPGDIKQGYWCPGCAGMQKGTIEGMQKIAKETGGKCLSKKYINSNTKLTWQCKNGHEWKATPGSIKQGSWCPACAKKK